MSFWLAVRKVIKDADVVLFILDARMPDLSMNDEVKDKVQKYGKKIFLVFNKIDLISEKELNSLKKSYGGAFFVSGTKNMGIKNLRKGLLIFVEKNKVTEMRIGVVGYPNVGKSSIINALSKRGSARVSNLAGTTKGIQWIKYGSIKFLDSPGVIPFEDKSSKLVILGAKNPEKLKNPYKVAYKLLGMFLKRNKPVVERYYNLKLSDNIEDVFHAIGKKRGYLFKGGVVDETKTSISIIRDWQRGKIKI